MGCNVQLSARGTNLNRQIEGNVHSVQIGEMSMNSLCWGKFVSRNVQIPMQDYKSLHAVVIICASLVNTHTQMDIFDQLYY